MANQRPLTRTEIRHLEELLAAFTKLQFLPTDLANESRESIFRELARQYVFASINIKSLPIHDIAARHEHADTLAQTFLHRYDGEMYFVRNDLDVLVNDIASYFVVLLQIPAEAPQNLLLDCLKAGSEDAVWRKVAVKLPHDREEEETVDESPEKTLEGLTIAEPEATSDQDGDDDGEALHDGDGEVADERTSGDDGAEGDWDVVKAPGAFICTMIVSGGKECGERFYGQNECIEHQLELHGMTDNGLEDL